MSEAGPSSSLDFEGEVIGNPAMTLSWGKRGQSEKGFTRTVRRFESSPPGDPTTIRQCLANFKPVQTQLEARRWSIDLSRSQSPSTVKHSMGRCL